jgi:hypothetical protein
MKTITPKLVLGSSPSEDFFVTLKLIMAEEHTKDQHFLFWQGDYRIRSHNPEESVWG